MTHEEIKQNIFNLIKPTDDDSEGDSNFDMEDIDKTPKPLTSVKKLKVHEEISDSKICNNNLSQKMSCPFELAEKTQELSSAVKKFEIIERTSISKIKDRKLSQEQTSFPLGVTDIGRKFFLFIPIITILKNFNYVCCMLILGIRSHYIFCIFNFFIIFSIIF